MKRASKSRGRREHPALPNTMVWLRRASGENRDVYWILSVVCDKVYKIRSFPRLPSKCPVKTKLGTNVFMLTEFFSV